jgi:serine O-acetyltransferase
VISEADCKMARDENAPTSQREILYAAALAKADDRRRNFFGNVRADIRRHGGSFFTRSVLGLSVFRLGSWALVQPKYVRIPALKIYSLLDKLIRPFTGLHMNCKVLVGDDFHLVHAEAPISIHPDVVIGDRVGIMHNVTIGAAIEVDGVPIIGNDVFIGTGAVVLGPVIMCHPIQRPSGSRHVPCRA